MAECAVRPNAARVSTYPAPRHGKARKDFHAWRPAMRLERPSPRHYASPMPTSMIIVDDFLGPADAEGLREAALGLTYPEQQGAFPGRNSVERMEIGGLTEAVSQLVGEPLKPIDRKSKRQKSSQ